MVDAHSGGAYCCKFSWIFRYDPQQGRYTGIDHTWGDIDYNDIDYKLKQSENGGNPEFHAYDTKFGYRLGGFAESRFPVQIWQYRQGELVNVIRQPPKQVSQQAEYFWQTKFRIKATKNTHALCSSPL